MKLTLNLSKARVKLFIKNNYIILSIIGSSIFPLINFVISNNRGNPLSESILTSLTFGLLIFGPLWESR